LSRIQLRLDGVAEPQVREAIGADVAEMNAMVASLLAFLNGEDDPEQPTTVDIAVLAATIVDEVSDRGDTAGYTGPTHLEVKVRQVAIRRALGNLVENAIHYSGTARITVENKGGHVILGVEDNGPGIPEDRLIDVLTPFMRLDDARARNTQGLGLGLAIVARTVERENGTLRLSNRIDGGLRAEISLPKA
jgi:signal transduction histidine kinase